MRPVSQPHFFTAVGRPAGSVSARCVPGGLTVQSGWPGIGGVLVP